MSTLYRAAILLTTAMALPVSADNNFGVGIKAGSLGIGIEGIWRPIGPLDLRLGANKFNYSDKGSQAGINYDGKLKLNNFYASANYGFPLSPFRVTAGVYANNNKINMISLDSPNFEVGGSTFSATEVGQLRGETTWKKFSPYLGAGLDFEFFGKLDLNLDFGVLLQGDPKVSLTSNGSFADTQILIDALEQERQELEDKFDALNIYPVVSLGFKFNF